MLTERAPYGVLLAVALSIIDLVRRVARPHDGVLGYVPGVAGMHDIDDYPDAKLVPGLVVYRYDAPLFFVNAEDFKERALKALDAASGDVEWFLLNAEAIVDIDIEPFFHPLLRCQNAFHRSHLDYGIDVGVGPDPRDPVLDRPLE